MGGYAPVIRATDLPVPPASAGRTGRPARPGSSDRPDDEDVYVYRDPSARAGYLAEQRAQEREAAYWYDMSIDPGAPLGEETRGPFEPLLSSSGPPPGAARQHPSEPDAITPTPAEVADRNAAGYEGPEEPTHAQARRLEQIKDLYLTAEAIGEENVDKHFDQLLSQQRELISEYFRQSAAARRADGLPAQADANPIEPRQPGGQVGPAGQVGYPGQAGNPEGAGVATPPRAW
jgi:hypothetical protein